MGKINYLQAVFLGGFAGAILNIVSYFVGLLPTFRYEGKFVSISAAVIDINLRQQILSQGFLPGLGNKILDLLQGNLGFSVTNLAASIMGGILIFVIGRVVYEKLVKKESKFMQKTRVLWSFVIGIGLLSLSAPLFFGLPGTTIISGLVYGLVVGLILQILVNIKGLTWIKE